MFPGLGVILADYISSVSEIEALKVMSQHERIWWEGSNRRKSDERIKGEEVQMKLGWGKIWNKN